MALLVNGFDITIENINNNIDKSREKREEGEMLWAYIYIILNYFEYKGLISIYKEITYRCDKVNIFKN